MTRLNTSFPPDPDNQNEDRSKWAQAAIQTFVDITGLDTEADGFDTTLSDLLADIAHFCDRNDLSFHDLLDRAQRHYQAETDGKGPQL